MTRRKSGERRQVFDMTMKHNDHRFQIIDWQKGDFYIWLTSKPKEDDLVLLPLKGAVKGGYLTTRIASCMSIDDSPGQYKIKLVLA